MNKNEKSRKSLSCNQRAASPNPNWIEDCNGKGLRFICCQKKWRIPLVAGSCKVIESQTKRNQLKMYVHIQDWQINLHSSLWKEIKIVIQLKSGVKDDIPTFAFPTHGLVVGIVIYSTIISNWQNRRRVRLAVLRLRICGYLNGFTTCTWTAPSLTSWGPRSYLSSHHRLILTYCLHKHKIKQENKNKKKKEEAFHHANQKNQETFCRKLNSTWWKSLCLRIFLPVETFRKRIKVNHSQLKLVFS